MVLSDTSVILNDVVSMSRSLIVKELLEMTSLFGAEHSILIIVPDS